MLFRWVIPVTVCLSVMAQHGDETEKSKKKNPAIGNPQAIEAGKKQYQNGCAACHGPSGQGGRGPNLRDRVMWHTLDDDAMFKLVQKGVPGTEMPASSLPEDQLWQVVAFVRSFTSPAIESPPPGDAKAGESLFWGKAGCNECHSILSRGGKLGPDLSNIGALRPLEQLREALLDPDADGLTGYRGVTVTLKDGRTVKGVAVDRTNYATVVRDARGTLHRLPAADIREIVFQKGSPMPRDFAKRLSRTEIDDLLSYLSQRTVRPPADSAKEEKK